MKLKTEKEPKPGDVIVVKFNDRLKSNHYLLVNKHGDLYDMQNQRISLVKLGALKRSKLCTIVQIINSKNS